MKKIIIMLLAAALAVGTLTACTGGETTDTSKDEGTVSSADASVEDKVPDMSAILEGLKADFSAEEKRERSEDEILMETGIEPSSYNGFFWLAEMSGLSSEKAVMYMAKDEASAGAIKLKLEAVLQSELAQMKDYNADNYAMLNKAVIEQKGVYVYFIVSPNVDKLAATINAAF